MKSNLLAEARDDLGPKRSLTLGVIVGVIVALAVVYSRGLDSGGPQAVVLQDNWPGVSARRRFEWLNMRGLPGWIPDVGMTRMA
jgi:hypothetical protein